MYQPSSAPICVDTRECFGRDTYRDQRRCKILRDTYDKDGECPFCKPKRDKPQEIKKP